MKAVFLDRDGVINEYPGDAKYVTSWDEFHYFPWVGTALKKLNRAGFKIFIISNQAGVSKGVFTKRALDLITSNMLRGFNKQNIDISGVYYCIHVPEDNCLCRKPRTGLVDAAINYLKNQGMALELKKSYFIGDTEKDIKTGKSSGLKTILVFSGKEKPQNRSLWQTPPDWTAQNLSEAVELILNHSHII